MLKTNLQYLEFQVVDYHRGNSCLALLRIAQPRRGLLANLVSEQATGVVVRLGRHALAVLIDLCIEHLWCRSARNR